MNTSQEILFIGMGLLVQFLLIVPFIQFIWKFIVRPHLNPHPIQKYYRKGSYALVVGAAGGAGRSYSFKLAEEGFNLILIDRRTDPLEEVKKEIEEKFKVKIILLSMDLLVVGEENWNTITQVLKENDVSVLVNNVGKAAEGSGGYGEIKYDILYLVMKLNMEVTSRMTHIYLNNSKKDAPKLIIFMSSCTCNCSSPFNCVYAATKGFILNLGRSIHYENELIDCTVFQPWHISTDMIGNIKPSLTIATADQFVEAAMKQVGLETATDPYWAHHCEDWAFWVFPEHVKAKIYGKEIHRFRDQIRGLKKNN